jgi:hypothetical protein
MKKEKESREHQIPDFLYDSQGVAHSTQELLDRVGASRTYNLRTYRRPTQAEGKPLNHGYKFSPEEIVWIAANDMAAVSARYPNRSRDQCRSLMFYAKKRVESADAHIKNSKKAP